VDYSLYISLDLRLENLRTGAGSKRLGLGSGAAVPELHRTSASLCLSSLSLSLSQNHLFLSLFYPSLCRSGEQQCRVIPRGAGEAACPTGHRRRGSTSDGARCPAREASRVSHVPVTCFFISVLSPKLDLVPPTLNRSAKSTIAWWQCGEEIEPPSHLFNVNLRSRYSLLL
jgi:hypothetical protein